MTPPSLPKPPVFGNRQTDNWFILLYKWLGEATGAAPLRAANITEQLDVSSQVTGQMDGGNLVPNAQTNTTNFATVDSIDAGADTTIRVYGVGGVATPWTRQVGTKTEGPFPSATLPGYGYGVTRQVYYKSSTNQYFAYDPATEYTSTLDPLLRWVGSVKTVNAGGGGGASGGGGNGGGSGGGRYLSTL